MVMMTARLSLKSGFSKVECPECLKELFLNCPETEVWGRGMTCLTGSLRQTKPQPCKTATLLSEPSWRQRKCESTPEVSFKKAVLGCWSHWAGRQFA